MKTNSKALRSRRVRAKISGTNLVPRLSVFASLAHVQAQIIDDQNRKTLVSASDLKMKEKMTKTQKATKVGEEIAEKAVKLGIKSVVFDRGPKLYHGRVKALAEGARSKGLKF